jgi:phosphate starvation-inducible PhoH-like protein
MARKKRVEKHNSNRGRNNDYGIIPLHKKTIPHILPRNVAQEDYLYQLADPKNNIVFAIGPAGTGKTLLCTQMGIKSFMEREKMAPWTRPIFDIFEKHFSLSQVEMMLTENLIEIAPLAYMRGRTFEDSWIIADEMQNATKSQMKMLLTRIGVNTKMIVTGDLKQHDRGFSENGLSDFIDLVKHYEQEKLNHIAVSKFDMMDVERHPAVTEVLKIYGEDD